MNIFVITGLLFLWNLFVIHYVSKWIYEYFKRFKNVPAFYVSRKAIHILNGGLTALLIPIFYERYYWVVTLFSFILASYLYLRRKWKPMFWFQVQENTYEVHFAIAYGVILMVGVLLEDIWIGLIPILCLSFGDSVTGLVRAFTQKQQVKSWDGTIAMFIVCSFISFWRLGWLSLVLGGIVSLVEKIPQIDDNITIPVVAAVFLYLF